MSQSLLRNAGFCSLAIILMGMSAPAVRAEEDVPDIEVTNWNEVVADSYASEGKEATHKHDDADKNKPSGSTVTNNVISDDGGYYGGNSTDALSRKFQQQLQEKARREGGQQSGGALASLPQPIQHALKADLSKERRDGVHVVDYIVVSPTH